MGLKGKLTAEVEVSTHGHHIHDFFAKKPHHISKISPSHIQGCEVHEGEFGKPGSIIYWNYTLDGKACVAKEVVEKVDEANKTLTLKVIEGHLLKEYSSFVAHLHATDKEVKWVFEYEKLHEDVPHPVAEPGLTGRGGKLGQFLLGFDGDSQAGTISLRVRWSRGKPGQFPLGFDGVGANWANCNRVPRRVSRRKPGQLPRLPPLVPPLTSPNQAVGRRT